MVRTGRFSTKGREEEEKSLYAHLLVCTDYLREATQGTGGGTRWLGTGAAGRLFTVYPPVHLEF